MRDLFNFLVREATKKRALEPELAFSHLGLSGKVYDMTVSKHSQTFSDETKSQIFYRQAIKHAQICPVCNGLLDASKSVSYDHITPVRDGGRGSPQNGQMLHPYCNSSIKG